MREIQAELLTNTVAQMCIRANYDLPRDVLRQLQSAQGGRAVARGRRRSCGRF